MPDQESMPDAPPELTAEAQRVARETDEAFTAFYRHNFKSLVAFLLMQGARLADAAELVQDTMTIAYRRWSDLDQPRAWAYRVASRALIRRLTTVHDVPVPEHPVLPLRSATDIERWEQQQEIVRLLSTLPPRQRQVMAWTLAEYTPTEIAAELRLTPEAVRSALLAARRALSGRMAGPAQEGDGR